MMASTGISKSARQRASLVLRLLAGEEPATVAAQGGVLPEVLLGWRETFLQGGVRALTVASASAATAVSADVDSPAVATTPYDDPVLDWGLEQERLGTMMLRAGEMVLRQRTESS